MISVRNLFYSPSPEPFIEDVSFSVHRGECFGLLGPAYSGKTTLLKILTGLLPEFQGSASIAGIDCRHARAAHPGAIGVCFSFSTLYDELTVLENLRLFAPPIPKASRSIEDLLSTVGLAHNAEKPVSEYSPGMKARLNFIKTLLSDPPLLLLDEPTMGLDSTQSQMMKELILKEKARGKTILLATSSIQDATDLCDRVAFIVNGKICTMDAPQNLIFSRGGIRITYTWYDHGKKQMTRPISAFLEDNTLKQLILENRLQSIRSHQPTLEDIFMDITGSGLG